MGDSFYHCNSRSHHRHRRPLSDLRGETDAGLGRTNQPQRTPSYPLHNPSGYVGSRRLPNHLSEEVAMVWDKMQKTPVRSTTVRFWESRQPWSHSPPVHCSLERPYYIHSCKHLICFLPCWTIHPAGKSYHRMHTRRLGPQSLAAVCTLCPPARRVYQTYRGDIEHTFARSYGSNALCHHGP